MSVANDSYNKWDEIEKKTGPLFGGCLQQAIIILSILTVALFSCNNYL